MVTVPDGRTLPAKLVGADALTDLAVLRVDATNLSGLAFAEVSELRVGDYVVAIGNPSGLKHSATSGIISVEGRSGFGVGGYGQFIQTDVPTDAGTSGGALVNLRGDLIGINTILTPPSSSVGIGLAIPSNIVSAIMTQLIEHGEVRHGRIGIRARELNAELAQNFNVDRPNGVVVVEVDKNSAAAKVGVVPGDIIVRLNDREIARAVDFNDETMLLMVGDTVALTVLREEREKRLTFSLAAEQWGGRWMACTTRLSSQIDYVLARCESIVRRPAVCRRSEAK